MDRPIGRGLPPFGGRKVSGLRDLLRGAPGMPTHPPLTDVSIGAYTVGVAMLVAGALGLEEHAMAHGSLLAISGGLLLTVPTSMTGILDWLKLPHGSSRRTVAMVHLFVMVAATLLFAGSWLAQRPGYLDGRIDGLGLALGLGGEALLAAGGYLGGALVFVYGVRVLKRPKTPIRDALVPGRLEKDGAPTSPGPGNRQE
jgi:uncharacterized membrane protein